MPIPKEGTQERAAAEFRIHRRIMDIVSNISVRLNPVPEQVHVLIYDEIMDERFGSFVRLHSLGESGIVHMTRTSVGMLAPGQTVQDIAAMLVREYPDTPLLLDEKIAKELAAVTQNWYTAEDGHHRLQGVAGGTVDVYIPINSIQLPSDSLPSDALSAQTFDE